MKFLKSIATQVESFSAIPHKRINIKHKIALNFWPVFNRYKIVWKEPPPSFALCVTMIKFSGGIRDNMSKSLFWVGWNSGPTFCGICARGHQTTSKCAHAGVFVVWNGFSDWRYLVAFSRHSRSLCISGNHTKILTFFGYQIFWRRDPQISDLHL